MEDRVKKLADNALLVLAARCMSIVGVPVGMAVLAWLITGQIAADKTNALHASAIAELREMDRQHLQALADMRRRQEDAATEHRRTRETDMQATRAVQDSIVRALALLDAQGRSLMRIEAFIDRQAERPAPRQ